MIETAACDNRIAHERMPVSVSCSSSLLLLSRSLVTAARSRLFAGVVCFFSIKYICLSFITQKNSLFLWKQQRTAVPERRSFGWLQQLRSRAALSLCGPFKSIASLVYFFSSVQLSSLNLKQLPLCVSRTPQQLPAAPSSCQTILNPQRHGQPSRDALRLLLGRRWGGHGPQGPFVPSEVTSRL